MNLAWTFGDLSARNCTDQTWQGILWQARPPGASKTSGDFADPPWRLLRLPKRIGLKSYLRLSALVVRSFSITSSDASTHFRPAWKPVERLNLRWDTACAISRFWSPESPEAGRC